MNITAEDKDHLIEQIEKLVGKRPVFYLKFCSRENYANDICEGNLYGNTASYFRQLEDETGERGQGDRYELQLSIQTMNITAYDIESGTAIFTAPKGVLKMQIKNDDEIPIISFVGIPLSDMILIGADENEAVFKLPFTDDEYKTMKERFGEYCVMIGARELEEKIASYCNYLECDYIFDKIEYCNQNRIDRVQAFNKSAINRFLYKNSDLSYQREYRMAVGIEMPQDHFIRIGKLSTAVVLKSIDLKNMGLSFKYSTEKIK